MKRIFSLPLLFLVLSCASTRLEQSPLGTLDGVVITFERYGALADLGSQRLAESGDAAVAPGKDYWLRLWNRSPYTIQLPTQSMYVSRPPEWIKDGPTTSGFAVKDGSVLVVLFQGFDGRYGFGDMSSLSYLPSQRSVLFQVPRKYLAKKREISVEFGALTDEVLRGELEPVSNVVSFNSSQIP